MEFLLLGDLDVRRDGEALDLARSKERLLLAILLLARNQVVSPDRLVEDLWNGEPPETARKALQVHVSQLRKLLGPGRVLTRPAGYLLRVDDEELDVARFEQLVDRGQYEQALALWRGSPLAEFSDRSFAQPEIARLEELRLACIEAQIDADLAAGRHAAHTSALEGLVNEHPLREHLRAQLMLALYRAGRQAEALEVYAAGRRLLADELGLEPGEALKRLQRAILAHDPRLDPADDGNLPPPPPSPTPADPPQPTDPVRQMRKRVTVLFAAVSIVPTGERIDPEAHRRLAGQVFAEIEAAVRPHGGTVDAVGAEGVTVAFGIPLVHEDDALRAARAATDARDRLAQLARPPGARGEGRLDVRFGVSTGEVVTGGNQPGLTHATGQPVTDAAVLARAADLRSIRIDAATCRLVRHAAKVDTLGDAFVLVSVDGLGERADGFESPLVGRGRERRRLHDAFGQAIADRSCQLFTVLGAAGVGKSRLVSEFLDDVAETAMVARGHCLSYGEGITYWPILEAVRNVTGISDTEPAQEARRRIAALVGCGDEAELVALRVAEAVGLADTVVSTDETSWAVRAFFEALARKRPLVLVFDDIHWAETTFLDLVEHIADWTHEAPILLVCLARPELLEVRPGWGGGKVNATSIGLEALSEQDAAHLLRNLAAGSLDESTAARIVAVAEGNPLFVEEMFALVSDFDRRDGELDVPETIQALLAARLDRLGREERAAIDAASVEGRLFHEGSVAEIAANGGRPGVRTCLLSLVRKELVRPDRPLFAEERAYRFRHLLIRDAAYDSIPKATRAGLHERHARWLEARAGDRVVEYEEVLGYHFEQAFRYRSELDAAGAADSVLAAQAARRLDAAGRRAFGRGDMPAASNLLGRAASLLPPDDPRRLELLVALGPALMETGQLASAGTILVEVIDAAAAADRRAIELHARIERAWLAALTDPEGRMDELEAVATRAIPFFERTNDGLGLTRAWFGLGMVNHQHCQGAAAAEALEHALRHARRAGEDGWATSILCQLIPELVGGPTPVDETARRCREVSATAGGNQLVEGTALGALGTLEAMRGSFDEARALCGSARDVAERVGLPFLIASVDYRLWHVEVLAGNASAAERAIRRRYEVLAAVGEKAFCATAAAHLARTLVELGEVDEALHFAQVSEDLSASDDLHSHIPLRMARAAAWRERGDLARAETAAREAVARGDRIDWLNLRADSLAVLSSVLNRAGRAEESRRAAEAAAGLYDRKGNVVSAADIRESLRAGP